MPNGNFLMNQGVEEINRAYGKALSVPIYDVEVDLNDIHPPHKEPVAAKLLDASLGLVYGKRSCTAAPGPYRPPSTAKPSRSCSAMRGKGLKIAAGEELLGFRLDGTETKAAIGGAYAVSIPAEGQSVAEVSYAFFNRNQDANLTNSGGYYPLAFKMPVGQVERHPDAEALVKADARPGDSRAGSELRPGQILLMGGMCPGDRRGGTSHRLPAAQDAQAPELNPICIGGRPHPLGAGRLPSCVSIHFSGFGDSPPCKNRPHPRPILIRKGGVKMGFMA